MRNCGQYRSRQQRGGLTYFTCRLKMVIRSANRPRDSHLLNGIPMSSRGKSQARRQVSLIRSDANDHLSTRILDTSRITLRARRGQRRQARQGQGGIRRTSLPTIAKRPLHSLAKGSQTSNWTYHKNMMCLFKTKRLGGRRTLDDELVGKKAPKRQKAGRSGTGWL